MIRVAPFAAILGLWATSGFAQALSIDPAVVIACHDATPIGETSPACVGAAANACQALEGGATTLGVTECTMAEQAVWDDLLNTNYQVLRDLFKGQKAIGQDLSGEELTLRLRDAQRAWIAFRDADCGFRYDIYRGGTIRSIVGANCALAMTAQRALELRDVANP